MSNALYEELAVAAKVNPASYSPGTQDSDAVDLAAFRRVMFVLEVGTIGASGTIDFKLQQSDTSGGAYTDIAGKSITQLTQAGGGSGKQAIVEIRADELADGKRFVRGRVTIGTAATPLSVVALAGRPRFAPVADQDLASVAEIIG
jgi:hypothetical protein